MGRHRYHSPIRHHVSFTLLPNTSMPVAKPVSSIAADQANPIVLLPPQQFAWSRRLLVKAAATPYFYFVALGLLFYCLLGLAGVYGETPPATVALCRYCAAAKAVLVIQAKAALGLRPYANIFWPSRPREPSPAASGNFGSYLPPASSWIVPHPHGKNGTYPNSRFTYSSKPHTDAAQLLTFYKCPYLSQMRHLNQIVEQKIVKLSRETP
jgi:hypothetical protein